MQLSLEKVSYSFNYNASLGILTPKNGVIYEGELNEGYKHGIGKLQFPDGYSYQGQFQNGYYHGMGVLK